MDISRMADISSISRTTLTHSAEHRTQEKSSTLAADHTDAFIKSEAAFTPAYTKRSAQKQPSDNNLTQRENSEDKVGAVKQNDGEGRAELLTQGVQHIIRAMLVKQGEVLTGNVPSVGAKLYAEELLGQIRQLYGNSAADENSPDYWTAENTAERMVLFSTASPSRAISRSFSTEASAERSTKRSSFSEGAEGYRLRAMKRASSLWITISTFSIQVDNGNI